MIRKTAVFCGNSSIFCFKKNDAGNKVEAQIPLGKVEE
jgi:hypothetical protein